MSARTSSRRDLPLGPVYHFCVGAWRGVSTEPGGHPQSVVKELAESQGLHVVAACPHEDGYCWYFELDGELGDPPGYITRRDPTTENQLRRMFPNLYGKPEDEYVS